MPRFLVPKRTLAHRIASIALYRALILQSSAAPVNNAQRTALRNAVRKRFRGNKELQSSRQIELAFRTGYEILDLLDASVGGNSESTAIIASLLAETPPYFTRSLWTYAPKSKPQPPSSACPPAEESMLAIRPRSSVPCTRHIPVIASANGLPFLRFKKPQPANLSRVLNQKLDARNKGFDRRNMLQNYWMPLAAHEDAWDEILHSHIRLDSWCLEPTWADTVQKALQDEKMLYDQRMLKDRRLAQKLQEIVDQEIEFARLEKSHRVAVEKKSMESV